MTVLTCTRWPTIKAGLDLIHTGQKLPTKQYIEIYTEVSNILTESGREVKTPVLYDHVNAFVDEKCTTIYSTLKSPSDTAEDFLKAYRQEWTRFEAAAKQTDHLFGYMNRHWVARVKSEQKDTGLVDIYTLHLRNWAEVVLDPLSDRMVKALVDDEKIVGQDQSSEGLAKSILDSLTKIDGAIKSGATRNILEMVRAMGGISTGEQVS